MLSVQDLRKMVTTDAEGRVKLDLSNKGLNRIPKAVSLIKELQVLDLSGNPISTIISSLSKLSNLHVLFLNDCKLKNVSVLPRLTSVHTLELSGNKNMDDLDTHLPEMKRLKCLNLSHCGFTELTAGSLNGLESLNLSNNPIKKLPKGLEKLRSLNLSGCGWTEIDAGLVKLTSLKELTLSENALRSLPDSFANLKGLKTLHLLNCELSHINVINQLTDLETLTLSKNKIKRLPRGFSNLKTLKKLYLGECELRQISTDVSELTYLEELFIPTNPIGSLPEDLSNLKHLKKLGLWECGLTEIGSEIPRLTSLEELYLGSNPIENIPENLSTLKNLRILHLGNCELKQIGTTVSQLTSLEKLNLSENLIEALPEDFSNLKKLQKLYLKRCGLKTFPTAIAQLASLEVLHLSENPLKTLPDYFSNLRKLNELALWGYRLTEVGRKITNQLTSLEVLFLTGNKIGEHPIDVSGLRKLKRLHLKGCGLREMPTGVTQLTLMEDLNLSENPLIKRLPESIANLKRLKKLSVWNCGLGEVPDEICDIPELEKLILGKNQLRKLPLNLKNLKHLQELNLWMNPLRVPPKEVSKQGIPSTFSYLSEIRHGESLHQKIVLLGSSKAGKTSLVKTLINGTPSRVDVDDRTIVLDKYIWEPRSKDTHLSVTFIDFGGDKWYTIVHHLFIEENAIFLLMVDLAEYTDDKFHEHIGSWLNTLLTRVPSARIRIVGTHADMLTNEESSSKREGIELEVKCKFAREGLHPEPSSIAVISSETMEGVSSLRDELLSLACKKGKVIPPDWLTLYKKLRQEKVKPYFQLKEVKSFDCASRKRRFGDENCPANVDNETRLHTILQFFHAIGSILWYQHTPNLSKFVFHNTEFLTKLLKDVFSERLETQSLCYDKEMAFKTMFLRGKFEQVKTGLLNQGIMPRNLLQCLWKYRKLDERVFGAMIHLFMHLDLCYPLFTTEGQEASYRFPWFLKDSVPGDPNVQQILFGPPAENCHRIVLEYEFFSSCPPPLYEKFAVRLHCHVHDKNSRIDWKDGVYADINLSRLVVHRVTRGTEAAVSLTVEGEEIGDLWTVLTSIHEEMKSVMSEWPGLKWENWLLCPHCLLYGIRKPSRFPGTQISEPVPRTCPEVTCGSDATMKVPSCLVYPVKDLCSLPDRHKKSLDKFTQQLKYKSRRKGIRVEGFGRLQTGGIGVEFLDQLIVHSNSVGIIRVETPTASYTGTVFRVGPRHVMTCYHVVRRICELVGEVALSSPLVQVCFNHLPSTRQEDLLILLLEPGVVWYNEALDVAVLQLRASLDDKLPRSLGYLLGNVNQKLKFHLIGHCMGGYKAVNLCCEARPSDHQDVAAFQTDPRFFHDDIPNLRDRRRTLLEASMTYGASGSPWFDDSGKLVLMEVRGFFLGEEHVFDQGVNLMDVYRQMAKDSEQVAVELFGNVRNFQQENELTAMDTD